jgi:hypothetical protein
MSIHNRQTRLSKDEVNNRVSHRGLELVGEYLGTHIKTLFKCDKDHIWTTEPNSVMRGHGCPDCKYPFTTKEQINNELSRLGRDIRAISEYINPQTKISFECRHSHIWQALSQRVIKGSGCRQCKIDAERVSKDTINEGLAKLGIKMIGNFIDTQHKSLFECGKGHRWEARANVKVRCPSCASYGFNPDKPAWEYAFVRGAYVKFGITDNLERRLIEHRKYGDIELIHTRYHDDGALAKKWENSVKSQIGSRYASKDECPDGWTETFSFDKLEKFLLLTEK